MMSEELSWSEDIRSMLRMRLRFFFDGNTSASAILRMVFGLIGGFHKSFIQEGIAFWRLRCDIVDGF